ncbi:hypothetical protein C2R22_19215 [Salinigranum rubrum]|uniref:Uncharacterized protein n=1 Tax=Salinigranum rubrum TaxID=755307 RepID=A0A2I8VNL7_9EURY|nr:hypothetical protein [Salinigranum rubrum]AUV83508.1 hypothetical protein C2R22_19215 [Salinigranum rubrum]
MESRGPVRGRGDADLAVETSEDDETVEYLADEDVVRYVAGWVAPDASSRGQDGPRERVPRYETTPRERWVETQCLTAAARAAAEHVSAELEQSGETISGGMTADVEGVERAAVVARETVLDRSGRVVSEPSAGFSALVEETPATVSVCYRLGGSVYERRVPVYARSDVVRLE